MNAWTVPQILTTLVSLGALLTAALSYRNSRRTARLQYEPRLRVAVEASQATPQRLALAIRNSSGGSAQDVVLTLAGNGPDSEGPVFWPFPVGAIPGQATVQLEMHPKTLPVLQSIQDGAVDYTCTIAFRDPEGKEHTRTFRQFETHSLMGKFDRSPWNEPDPHDSRPFPTPPGD